MTDNELVKAEREKELVECLTWLQHRMDEYDDKEAYQDDYKMASIAWNFIRARIPENAELKEAQRWVPIGERLPEEPYGCLLVVEEDDHCGEPREVLLPYFAGYDGDGWNDGDGQRVPFEVTHWMQLPAPPKEGE